MLSRCHRLSYADWPIEDRRRWEEVTKKADDAGDPDPFTEGQPILDRTSTSHSVLRSAYSALLGFLSTAHPERLALTPEVRLDEPLIVEYAKNLLETSRGTTV